MNRLLGAKGFARDLEQTTNTPQGRFFLWGISCIGIAVCGIRPRRKVAGRIACFGADRFVRDLEQTTKTPQGRFFPWGIICIGIAVCGIRPRRKVAG